jgi:Tol biopolymer transport system component
MRRLRAIQAPHLRVGLLAVLSLFFVVALNQPDDDAPGWTINRLTRPNDDLNPQWSPDGRGIAFVGHHEGNPEVYVWDMARDTVRNVSRSLRDDYAPLWSPNGEYLAFLHRPQPYTAQPNQLRIVHLDTGRLRAVTDHLGAIDAVKWSDDSRRLWFRMDSAYYVYEVASRDLRELYHISTPNTYFDTFVVSPDGRWAVIGITHFERDSPAMYVHIYLLDTTSGALEETPFSQFRLWQVVWSRDSSRVAVINSATSAMIYDVASRTLHGIRGAALGGVQVWDWSFDNRLVWTETTQVGYEFHTTIWVGDGQTHPIRELFTIHHAVDLVRWSPTENLVAFQTYAGVYVLDADRTGVLHQYVQGIGKINAISWSADGRYIATHINGLPGRATHVTAVSNVHSGELSLYDNNTYTRDAPHWSGVGSQLAFSSGDRGKTDLVVVTMQD